MILPVHTLYIDVETMGVNESEYGNNPYRGDKIVGIAYTWDEENQAYYLPIRHVHGTNVDMEEAYEKIRDLIENCAVIVNHNLKFDMHFLCKEICDIPENVECIDTLTLSKMVLQDRTVIGGYGLDVLSMDLLKNDISKFEEEIKLYLLRSGTKNYGRVPIDIMSKYAKQDVLTTRGLYKHLVRITPKECEGIINIEKKLTRVLYNMERRGVYVNIKETEKAQLTALLSISIIQASMHEIVGEPFNPESPKQCEKIILGKYQLKPFGLTKAGKPSFDYNSIIKYSLLPEVKNDANLSALFDSIIKYRDLSTTEGTFLRPYQELAVNGFLHPSFNQVVRTGRMSCSKPNMQQLNKDAKKLIEPREGYLFISADYSQVEFRIIAHYLGNKKIIEAYNKDPNTDFHQWVADLAGIQRGPAKNINFCMSYGGGKEKVLSMLASDPSLIGVKNSADSETAFNMFCRERAVSVYEEYHRRLPELKTQSQRAGLVAIQKGYVRTAYGRRRYLPRRASFCAFNSVIQGSAADVIKDTTTVLVNDEEFKKLGLHLVLQVHDENLFECPIDGDVDAACKLIKQKMENTSVKFSIPIKVEVKISRSNWAEMESVKVIE